MEGAERKVMLRYQSLCYERVSRGESECYQKALKQHRMFAIINFNTKRIAFDR